jgi:hypothetical protein
MMEVLKFFGGIGLLILMPILYIGGIFLLLILARWIYMFIGVITGDRKVIDEFDCRDKKEPYWSKVLDSACRGATKPFTNDDQFKNRPLPRRPRDWRGRR